MQAQFQEAQAPFQVGTSVRPYRRAPLRKSSNSVVVEKKNPDGASRRGLAGWKLQFASK